jgi:hypothetical protein
MLFTRTVKHVFISDGLADEIGGRLGSIFKRPTSNGFCWFSEMSISSAIGVGRLLVQYFQHISRPFTQMDVLVIVKKPARNSAAFHLHKIPFVFVLFGTKQGNGAFSLLFFSRKSLGLGGVSCSAAWRCVEFGRLSDG